jgi:hypothetical protein
MVKLRPAMFLPTNSHLSWNDQIGVSQDDFQEALGRKWRMSNKFPFIDLRSRLVGAFIFVTIEAVNPYSVNGSGA